MRLDDLSGKVFGRLTVISRSINRGNISQYLCRCDCGNDCIVDRVSLKFGSTKSCGCLRREVGVQRGKASATHGHYQNDRPSPTYNSWMAMWRRCTSKKHPAYARYGGRGITITDQWKAFTVFLADMGLRPEGKTLDRINNDKGYSPENCRWATPREQRLNQSPRAA